MLAAPVAALRAELYTVEIRGVVTEARNTGGRLPPALATAQPGQYFEFRYFVDGAYPDTDSSPQRGRYRSALFSADPGMIESGTVRVAAGAFVIPHTTGAGADDLTLNVLDNISVGSTTVVRDQFSNQKVGCVDPKGLCFNLIVLAYTDGTAQSPPAVLRSDAFSPAPLALELFATRRMRFHAGSADNVRMQTNTDYIHGEIQQVRVTSGLVPAGQASAPAPSTKPAPTIVR
jgi:hypothetical protein